MKHTAILYIVCVMQIFFYHHTSCQKVTAEISYGELIDKITILTIKSERIIDENKLKNIRTELQSLQET
ncbi:MAG TPA: hypothetical protein VK431_00505, partial [Nitrosopumilaceae archaeon]|nr:hypothetical protein [Nitrosopumilaceae archaeon]